MDIDEFLAAFPYADTTIRTYRGILVKLLALEDLSALTASGLLAFVRRPGWGNSRHCLALAVAQKYIRWKFGDSHPALAARIKRITGRPQRALDDETALKLLASFDRYTPKGARDLAICSLALDTGLRCSELCRLLLVDVNLSVCNLDVIVKGGHWEAAVFSTESAAYIAHWLESRRPAPGVATLFINIQTGARLTSAGLNKIVGRWGARLGIRLSPHDLRRTFTVLATEEGAPERVLMAGGRWTDSRMISRYTRTLKLESMRKYLPMGRLMR
jgi:integrase